MRLNKNDKSQLSGMAIDSICRSFDGGYFYTALSNLNLAHKVGILTDKELADWSRIITNAIQRKELAAKQDEVCHA